eukprot:5836-Pyramimonas_sp.AAC.1
MLTPLPRLAPARYRVRRAGTLAPTGPRGGRRSASTTTGRRSTVYAPSPRAIGPIRGYMPPPLTPLVRSA